MRGKSFFLDTNILLSATDRSRPDFSAARRVFTEAVPQGYHLCISPQIIREYLVVATRPVSVNGLGLSTQNAIDNIEHFRKRTLLLEENNQSAAELLSLLSRYTITGKKIHDAHIAALMVHHVIPTLITCNIQDFEQFAEISLETPESFLRR